MAFKILRNKTKKHRSLPFLSHKPSNRALSSAQHGSVSSLIDRQPISPELEAEIRYASALLYHSIEQGVPLPHSQAQPVDADNGPVETKPATKPTADYLRPSTVAQDSLDEYDSGIGLQTQDTNSRPSTCPGPSRFYKQQPNQQALENCSSDNASAASRPRIRSATVRLVDEASESESGEAHATSHSVQSHTETSPAGNQPGARPDPDAASEEVFLNPDAASMLRRAPSLGLSRSGRRSNRAKRTENPRTPSRPESKTNPALFDNTTQRSSEQGRTSSEHQTCAATTSAPTQPIGLSLNLNQNHEDAVIVDDDGLMHVMSATEETQRHVDLQQAVREKMSTGMIGATSSHDSTEHDPGSHRQPDLQQAVRVKMSTGVIGDRKSDSRDHEPEPGSGSAVASEVPADADYPQPQNRRASKPRLLKRLSHISIGRRKTAPAAGDRSSAGFRRIVDPI
ncbi:hypothetical protein PHISP_02791 [Aspergillus sp. HF37]|nr:hypothetical protein PHISP_02791 [Aspergillus sp. HF37]